MMHQWGHTSPWKAPDGPICEEELGKIQSTDVGETLFPHSWGSMRSLTTSPLIRKKSVSHSLTSKLSRPHGLAGSSVHGILQARILE